MWGFSNCRSGASCGCSGLGLAHGAKHTILPRKRTTAKSRGSREAPLVPAIMPGAKGVPVQNPDKGSPKFSHRAAAAENSSRIFEVRLLAAALLAEYGPWKGRGRFATMDVLLTTVPWALINSGMDAFVTVMSAKKLKSYICIAASMSRQERACYPI